MSALNVGKCDYSMLQDQDLQSEEALEEFSGRAICQLSRRFKWLVILALVLESIQLLVFGVVYRTKICRSESSGPAPEVDGLAALTKYNTTVTFTNDVIMVEASDSADAFWVNYVPYSAVVAIHTDVVQAQDILESAVSPTNSNEILYQVDGFHELHCLHRLRRCLVGTATREDHAHILHCLNYIRQTLMCNLDLTLGTTDDLENYGLKDKRVCRDYGAIKAWVERNNWNDFEDFQATKTEAHLAQIANGTVPKSRYGS